MRESWDELRIESMQRKMSNISEARMIEQRRIVLTDARVSALTAEAKYREAKATLVKAKIEGGTEDEHRRPDRQSKTKGKSSRDS